MKKIFLFFIFFLISSLTFAQTLPLNEIYKFADGMNIEGGRMMKNFAKDNQIWLNLCVVLDRPFIDGVEWKELTEKNTYPMKEASILDYNEARVSYCYLTIMHYYIKQAHTLIKKQDECVKINIHVYRGTTGPKQIALLKELLFKAFNDISIDDDEYFLNDENVKISFSYGTMKKPLVQEKQLVSADINLTFSLMVGLNFENKSGTLVIPFSYTPFSIKNEPVYDQSKKYFVNNHLLEAINDIILNQPLWFLDCINKEFLSKNPMKKDQVAMPLVNSDFKFGELLEIDGDFNPSEVQKTFETIEKE